MSYAGLDLSRKRLDVHVLDEEGTTVEMTAVRPDADALRTLASHVYRHGQEVTAVIESMTGARFVHDQLELRGWDVAIGDAVKVKGLAPLAAKTDKIDAWVLAELARRDLVPEVWLSDPSVRAERERVRFRLHLVRHRSAPKDRIHATLLTFGHPVPVADLFGVKGRELLARMDVPEPWRSSLATSLAMVDDLDERIDACAKDLRTLGTDHPGHPVAGQGARDRMGPGLHHRLGDRGYPSVPEPEEADRLHGLCPKVYQSGDRDVRGPLATNGPKYLRWALIEAATHAARDARYRERYERNKRCLGRQRGAKVARVELARRLAETIWRMLTKNEPFAPAGPAMRLVA